ncbi:hypothetical protein GE09DRAFT_1154423 [Coniochaeta sp. 2T2.1]|nr:hypothetical protein GE09DRAFT_1154423 [Coniochaeta sp. 2T2.1]
MNECHCTICYKYGVLWMYYKRKDVVMTIAPDTHIDKYIRHAEETRGSISFNRCGHCGCMTHWWGENKMLGEDRMMGVNFRMLPEKDIEGFGREVTYGPEPRK